LKDRLQFSILNFSKIITHTQRERERERERESEEGKGGEKESWRKRRECVTRRLRRRRSCVRWRQAAFSHSLNRGTELGSSASYLVPYASCPALSCLASHCHVLLCFSFACWHLPYVVTSFLAPVLLRARSE